MLNKKNHSITQVLGAFVTLFLFLSSFPMLFRIAQAKASILPDHEGDLLSAVENSFGGLMGSAEYGKGSMFYLEMYKNLTLSLSDDGYFRDTLKQLLQNNLDLLVLPKKINGGDTSYHQGSFPAGKCVTSIAVDKRKGRAQKSLVAYMGLGAMAMESASESRQAFSYLLSVFKHELQHCSQAYRNIHYYPNEFINASTLTLPYSTGKQKKKFIKALRQCASNVEWWQLYYFKYYFIPEIERYKQPTDSLDWAHAVTREKMMHFGAKLTNIKKNKNKKKKKVHKKLNQMRKKGISAFLSFSSGKTSYYFDRKRVDAIKTIHGYSSDNEFMMAIMSGEFQIGLGISNDYMLHSTEVRRSENGGIDVKGTLSVIKERDSAVRHLAGFLKEYEYVHKHKIAIEYPKLRRQALKSMPSKNIPPAQAHKDLETDAYLMMLPLDVRKLICPKLTVYHENRRQRASRQKEEGTKSRLEL